MKKLVLFSVITGIILLLQSPVEAGICSIISDAVKKIEEKKVVMDHGILPPPSNIAMPERSEFDVWLPYVEPDHNYDLARVGLPYQIAQAVVNVGSNTYVTTADNAALFSGGDNYLLKINDKEIQSLVLPGIGVSLVVQENLGYVGYGVGGKKGLKSGLAIVNLQRMEILGTYEVPGGDWTAPNNCRILEIKGKEIKISYLFTSQKEGFFLVDAIIDVTNPLFPMPVK